MKQKVQEILEPIRHVFQVDGGDGGGMDVTAEGVVKVRLTGACGSCLMSTMTLKMSIGRTLLQHFSGINDVGSFIAGLGQATS